MKKGDIIAIQENIYIDYPGGRWYDHFVSKRKYYVLCDTPSNNGNVLLKDSKNKKMWYNVNIHPYKLIREAAV